MNTKNFLTIGIATSMFVAGLGNASAATYSGNGNTGFGGPIGLGTLSLSDDGTTLSGTFSKGPNGFNDALVIYIQSGAGGFADTSGFADAGDGLRKAISGFDGGGNRSTMTFTGGFLPNFAIALGPADDSFGGVWQLANGGNNSFNFMGSANLSPLNNSSSTYTFSLLVTEIGLTPNSGQTIELFGTYISDTGYRSDEAVAGTDAGTQGYNPFVQAANASYMIVPEPSCLALFGFGGMAALAIRRRRK
jgi:hypothetical protein